MSVTIRWIDFKNLFAKRGDTPMSAPIRCRRLAKRKAIPGYKIKSMTSHLDDNKTQHELIILYSLTGKLERPHRENVLVL